MPRIIVTTDTPERTDDRPVLLDELVHSVHLSSGHAAAQLIERLAWAISDAEEAERTPSDRHRASQPPELARQAASRHRERRAIAA